MKVFDFDIFLSHNKADQGSKHMSFGIGHEVSVRDDVASIFSKIPTTRLWDIPGDLDFPHEHLVLQVQAFALAREHAKSCQYKRQNVYLRFFPTEEK
jgi:hypothetical protein